jgi:hypothetical protein
MVNIRNSRPIQFVVTFHLQPVGTDPREQLRRRTCDLVGNLILKVHTHGITPPPFGIPFVNAMDFEWYRPDLAWQFIDEDERVIARWNENISHIRAWI